LTPPLPPPAPDPLPADLESRVEERTRALKEANGALEAFVGMVSHDLRAPLRHLEGFAELLTRHLESGPAVLDDQSRHYLVRITEASQTMRSLLEDLLAYARLASAELQVTTVDLDRLLASLVSTFAPGPVWELGALGQVRGSAPQLRQAFASLLANAVKFSAPVPAPRIWVRRAGTRAGRTLFEVGDNGVGFDPAFADQLFGVFGRLHPRGDFPGNGMGLAMVARVLQRHQGEVWAESSPGAGARFFLTLEPAGEAP